MNLPTLFSAGVRASTPGALDAHGNPEKSWGPAASHPVCGWSAPSSGEPKLAGHDRVVVDIELIAPVAFPAKPQDLVVLEGREFEVLGEPEDYEHGPFGFRPGVLIWNLQRVEG